MVACVDQLVAVGGALSNQSYKRSGKYEWLRLSHARAARVARLMFESSWFKFSLDSVLFGCEAKISNVCKRQFEDLRDFQSLARHLVKTWGHMPEATIVWVSYSYAANSKISMTSTTRRVHCDGQQRHNVQIRILDLSQRQYIVANAGLRGKCSGM